MNSEQSRVSASRFGFFFLPVVSNAFSRAPYNCSYDSGCLI